MRSLEMVTSLLPSLVLVLAWAAGAALCLLRPEPGRWRVLAMAGFATLAAATVVGLLPQIVLMVMGYSPGINIATLFAAFGLLAVILSLVGIGLLIAAMISERSGPRADPALNPAAVPPTPSEG